MVTVQELENVKIDVRTAGEAVNENKIVTPRYGVPFKSFPMIAEEMQSVIGTIIAGGVPANIVADASGLSQQQVNDNNEAALFDRYTKSEMNSALSLKANQLDVDVSLALKADKSYTFTKSEVGSLVSPKADTAYVDAAVGAISTDASKQYATLALANADIANIALNQNVFISEEVNGGYWYKATGGATVLTKSLYDPLTQSKEYTESYTSNFQDDAGIHARTRQDLLNNGLTDSERVASLLTIGGNIGFKSGDLLLSGKSYASLANLSGLSFSRASNALVLDINGVYQSFSANTPRQITGKGLLLEKEATQRLTHPVDFSNAAWTKMNVTVSAIANAAPDLIGNAFDIVESATGSGSSYIQGNAALQAGNNCFSAFLSRGSNRYAQMFVGISSNTYAISIDFDSEIVRVASGALTPVSFGLEKIKNNLYRVWLSVSVSGAVSATVHIRGAGGLTFADRTYTRTDGNVAARAAWAQVEAGLTPTSPILVGDATRATDICMFAWDGINPDDEIVISYMDNKEELKRSDLSNPNSINLMSDGAANWLGYFISSVLLFPARVGSFYANYKDVDMRASALGTQDLAIRANLLRLMAKLGEGDLSLDFSEALSVTKPTESGCTPYLHIDRLSNNYYWHGQVYDTEDSLLAESGGLKNGNTTTWAANHLSSDILFLADFSAGIDGFSSVSAGSVVNVNGELEFTASASTGTFSRSFRGFGGKALRLSAKYRKGTSVGARIGASSYNQSLTFSPLVTAGSNTNLSLDFSPVVGRQFWIGGGQNGGTLGTSYFSDFKLQELFPCAGFPQGRHTLVINGVMPSTLPSSEQILYQLDCGGNNNDREYLAVDTTGSVTFVTRYWGVSGVDATQRKILNLGTLASSQSFRIAVSVKNSQVCAAMNGVGSTADTTGSVGGSHLRIGRGLIEGADFTGTINKFEIYKGSETLNWCIDSTAPLSTIAMYKRKPKQVLMVGDSWAEDSSTGIGPMLRDLGFDVFSVGVGGSTMEAQVAYALAEPDLLKNSLIIWWDGVPNGHINGQIANEQSYLLSVLTAAGHSNFVWCRNGQAQVDNTQQADMDLFRTWILQKYGADHVYDPTQIYIDNAIKDPSNLGYSADQSRITLQRVPYSLMTADEAHLKPDIRRIIARDLQKSTFKLMSV